MNEVKVEQVAIGGISLNDEMVDHPTIYADQVMGLAYGPFVSRFTLAMENHVAGTRTPVATVVMPTAILHSIFAEVSKILSSDDVRKQFADGYKGYLGADVFK